MHHRYRLRARPVRVAGYPFERLDPGFDSYPERKGIRCSRERRRLARQRLEHWQDDRGLASLRDQAALAQLPPGEQEACRQFWAEVEGVLARARAAP